jgi:hypothetical protein
MASALPIPGGDTAGKPVQHQHLQRRRRLLLLQRRRRLHARADATRRQDHAGLRTLGPRRTNADSWTSLIGDTVADNGDTGSGRDIDRGRLTQTLYNSFNSSAL